MNLFITGDRSLHPLHIAPGLALTLLKHRFDNVYTGDLPGVEFAVSALMESAGWEPAAKIESPIDESTGKPDFNLRWQFFDALPIDKIYVLHPDPHASRIYTSLLGHPTLGDITELLLPDVLVV